MYLQKNTIFRLQDEKGYVNEEHHGGILKLTASV